LIDSDKYFLKRTDKPSLIFFVKKRLLNILFWSVISAAFIGPGTVTTAAAAGAGFGYALIWALLFSTIACYVLQEASARITAVSGMNLGQAMKAEFSYSTYGKSIVWLSLIAIVSGCAAFEAGNILGAVAGVQIVAVQVPVPVIVLLIGAVAAGLLWNGNIGQIARLLGVIVAFMAVCFVITAISLKPDIPSLLLQGFSPSIPSGAEIVVLGLIGTTVVPYNIFLGSGLKHSQTPTEMKSSMAVAIGLGGLVSVAILITGTAISGSFSFPELALALEEQLGSIAPYLLATGLFGAGLSSALTAALAASITAQSVLYDPENPENWSETSLRFRLVWGSVLVFGVFFGLLNMQPVPIIILAQALNGIILPIIAIILFLVINNERVLPKQHQNKPLYNIITSIVVYLTVLIGLTNVLRAASRVFEFTQPGQLVLITISLIVFLILMIPVFRKFKNH